MNKRKKLCLMLALLLACIFSSCTVSPKMGEMQLVPINLSRLEQRQREISSLSLILARIMEPLR